MADTPQTLSSISNALGQKYPDRIVRNINRMSVLLAILPIVAGAGKNCAWDAEGDGAIAENFSEGADVSNYGSDTIQPATLNWGAYRSNFRIHHLAAAAAATNVAGPNDARDLLTRNIMNGASKLASVLNAAAYSGAGTGTTLAGLHGIAVDSTGTYANIDPATYTWWVSTETDSASELLTLDQIRTDLGSIYDQCGMTPDFALCSTAVFNKIKALFDASLKYNVSAEVTTVRGTMKLVNSPEVIVIDGCQFIRDKDATASAIIYCNSEFMEWQVLAQPQGFASPLVDMIGQTDPSAANLLRGLYAYELGRTGSSRKVSIEAHLQLVIRRRNAFGKRINIG